MTKVTDGRKTGRPRTAQNREVFTLKPLTTVKEKLKLQALLHKCTASDIVDALTNQFIEKLDWEHVVKMKTPIQVVEEPVVVESNVDSSEEEWTDEDYVIAAKEVLSQMVGKVPTGWKKLDKKVGGINSGLTILGGANGAFKTSFAVQLANFLISQQYHVFYHTFVDSYSSIVMRSLVAHINSKGSKKYYPSELNKRAWPNEIKSCAKEWIESDFNYYFEISNPYYAYNEDATSEEYVSVLVQDIKERKNHEKKPFVIIDDLQAMAAMKYIKKDNSHDVRTRIEDLLCDLRCVQNELKVPFLILSSLSRTGKKDADQNGVPSIHTLKETGMIEDFADAVLMLHRNDNNLVLACLKDKWGPMWEHSMKVVPEALYIYER